jgi:hypothetical protein
MLAVWLVDESAGRWGCYNQARGRPWQGMLSGVVLGLGILRVRPEVELISGVRVELGERVGVRSVAGRCRSPSCTRVRAPCRPGAKREPPCGPGWGCGGHAWSAHGVRGPPAMAGQPARMRWPMETLEADSSSKSAWWLKSEISPNAVGDLSAKIEIFPGTCV